MKLIKTKFVDIKEKIKHIESHRPFPVDSRDIIDFVDELLPSATPDAKDQLIECALEDKQPDDATEVMSALLHEVINMYRKS